MRKSIAMLAALALLTPGLRAANEQLEVRRAADIVQRLKSIPENEIPRSILRDARGVAVLRVYRAGLVGFGVKAGHGVVVARTARGGWSGPVFISTGGAGIGPQIGGQVNEVVLILNNQRAVDAFARGGNVRLGGDLSVAIGPVGRDLQAAGAIPPPAAVYAYSISKGLFAGAQLEGTVVASDQRANARYYGAPVDPRSVLSGRVRMASPSSQRLVAALR